MRISTISTNYSGYGIKAFNNGQKQNAGKILKNNEIPLFKLSFKGNPSKHPEQIAAFATESNYLGGIYTSGGLGDVANLLPESIGKKGEEITGKKIDIRSFFPYYSMDDEKGRIYVLTKEGAEQRKNLKDNEFLDIKRDFKQVEQNYKLQEGESFAVITLIDGNTENKRVKKYFLLNDTGVTGTVERMQEKGFNMEKVPYRLFEVVTNDRNDRKYLIHTHEHAAGKSSYGVYNKHNPKSTGAASYGMSANSYGPSSSDVKMLYSVPKTDDMFYTEQLRAYEQLTIEGKMNTAAHGNFNPQNHLFHDRFSYAALTDVVQKANSGDENFKGLVFDEIMHNPGAAFQGKYSNPLDFFRIIATDKDLATLQANKHYEQVKAIAGKIESGSATEEECTRLYKFFKPFFSKLMDTEGLFNMTMIAVRMTDENPQNSSIGNVSRNYGKESRNLRTTDIAKGLTQPLINIESKTIDVVNGSKQANMATDQMGKFFGTGTLNEVMKTKYTPYKVTDNPDKIFKAKMANKKVVLDEIAKATKMMSKDPDALAKVFFSDDKISKLRRVAAEAEDPNVKLVLGSMSEYKNGDMLFIGWGRPDPQKGFTVTLEAFEKLLKDESIPLETRKHCKLVMGSGSGGEDMFTNKSGDEWKIIQNTIERIENIEAGGKKGIFKGNVIYTNGTYPARIANCADLGVLTSRFEPCGITPLECFASGTPVVSTNTGGAPDFIRPGINGFLTKDPFMINPEEIGLNSNATKEEIDAARRTHIAKQIAEQIKAYLEPIKNNSWEAKQKEFIKNCAGEKIEWHNNNAYNDGRSALEIYLKDKFHVMDNNVPDGYKSDMRGIFDDSAFPDITGKGKQSGKISKGGKWAIGIAATALIAGGIYAFINRKPSTSNETVNEEDNDDKLSLVV